MIRIYSILWLAFVVWIITRIWQAPMTQETKLMWTGIVVFFPGIGILAWFFHGQTRY